jgi:hypothetical protein
MDMNHMRHLINNITRENPKSTVYLLIPNSKVISLIPRSITSPVLTLLKLTTSESKEASNTSNQTRATLKESTTEMKMQTCSVRSQNTNLGREFEMKRSMIKRFKTISCPTSPRRSTN